MPPHRHVCTTHDGSPSGDWEPGSSTTTRAGTIGLKNRPACAVGELGAADSYALSYVEWFTPRSRQRLACPVWLPWVVLSTRQVSQPLPVGERHTWHTLRREHSPAETPRIPWGNHGGMGGPWRPFLSTTVPKAQKRYRRSPGIQPGQRNRPKPG